jgi:hypothetical protein
MHCLIYTQTHKHSHSGMVLKASMKHADALRFLELAEELDPNNPLCKFHKANVHVDLGR